MNQPKQKSLSENDKTVIHVKTINDFNARYIVLREFAHCLDLQVLALMHALTSMLQRN